MPSDIDLLAMPRLEPLFPCTTFTPYSPPQRPRRGSKHCCMVSHSSGLDHKIRPGTADEATRDDARRRAMIESATTAAAESHQPIPNEVAAEVARRAEWDVPEEIAAEVQPSYTPAKFRPKGLGKLAR